MADAITTVAVADTSLLVVIDLQQKLLAAMPQQAVQQGLRQSRLLLTAAEQLAIPVVITEQYPKGLGNTEPSLLQCVPDVTPIAKTAFSAWQDLNCQKAITAAGRQQVILLGLETHICVLQTALAIQQQGYEVQVVTDAVLSRQETHKQQALSRLQAAGIVISNSESVLFEWLSDATHPAFKALSSLLLTAR